MLGWDMALWECSQGAGPLLDIILRDYLDGWFGRISTDPEFVTGVQDVLSYAAGELLMRIKQRVNPLEFILHQGSLLVRHHLAMYTEARRKAAVKHPEAFPDRVQSSKWWDSTDKDADPFEVARGSPRNCIGATGQGSPAAPLSTVEGFQPSKRELTEVEACKLRNRYILEELQASNVLHPAFSYSKTHETGVTDSGDVSGKSSGVAADPIELNAPGERPSHNEMEYLRFVVGHIVKHLFDQPERGVSTVKPLGRELFVAFVLCPIINLISSDNINNWILLGFRAGRNRAKKQTPTGLSEAQEENGSENIASQEDGVSAPGTVAPKRVISLSPEEEKLFETLAAPSNASAVAFGGAEGTSFRQGSSDAVSGVPPAQFRPTSDLAWRHLVGAYDEVRMDVDPSLSGSTPLAQNSLCPMPTGNGGDYFSGRTPRNIHSEKVLEGSGKRRC